MSAADALPRAPSPGSPTLWESYRTIYNTFYLSLNQRRILYLISRILLKDFPKSLPSNLAVPVARALEEVVQVLGKEMEYSEDRLPRDSGVRFHSEDEAVADPEIFARAAMIFAQQLMTGKEIRQLDFERLVCEQELTMVFAHLDAFWGDSVRAVCRVCPEVMKSGSTMKRETILSFAGWDPLIAHLVEEFVFEFTVTPVEKRVKLMRDRLGLPIQCPQSAIALLVEAETVRNVVVHNGGRITAESINRIGRSDLVVGDFVDVKHEYVSSVLSWACVVASVMFVEISKKFFDRSENELGTAWQWMGTTGSGEKAGDAIKIRKPIKV